MTRRHIINANGDEQEQEEYDAVQRFRLNKLGGKSNVLNLAEKTRCTRLFDAEMEPEGGYEAVVFSRNDLYW